MPLLDEVLTLEILRNREKIGDYLAKQKPYWQPGECHGYHIFTYGLLIDQLIWRVDPEKRTLGQFFKEEIVLKFGKFCLH